jgi:hypothetical protein
MKARSARVLTGLALVSWVGPAVTQAVPVSVSAGSKGYLSVVDAHNKLVGFTPPINVGTNLDKRLAVSISVAVQPGTSPDSLVLELSYNTNSQGPQEFVFTPQPLYYTTTNCTGQPYVNTLDTHGIIGARFGVVGPSDVLFVSVRDPEVSEVTHINSNSDLFGACDTTLGDESIEGFAVNATISLDTVWQLPFKLR